MSRARPTVADRQLTLDVPEWRWQFRVPVVETQKNNTHSRLHWPDLDADEPVPACKDDGYQTRDVEWIAKEFCGGLAAFRVPCQNEECLEQLARQAWKMGVEFDG